MNGEMAVERIDIERLVVWAMVDQGLGFVGRESSALGFEDYGTVIDVSPVQGLPSIALWTSDDALVVRQGIDALPTAMAAMVLKHGRASSRPDWGPEGYGALEQMRNRRGQMRWDYAIPGNKRSPRTPRMDYWAHEQRRIMVDFLRTEWAVWWRGLELLVPFVNGGRMTEHLATGPEAPKEPWLAGDVPEADLPLAAQARLKGYAERSDLAPDDVVGGQVTVHDVVAEANAPIASVADLWGPGTSGVEVARVGERVAEVGRQALRERLGGQGDSGKQGAGTR